MRAMVEMAIAQTDVARSARTPDFTAGLMADLKADPFMVRPTATMTLPIWREKISEAISSADSRRFAAQARLSAEQIGMAAELAQMLFMIREADQMLAYIDESALPNMRTRSVRPRQAMGQDVGFCLSGRAATDELDMRLERVDVRREREAGLADLASFVASMCQQ